LDLTSFEILGRLGISMLIGVALMVLSATAGWIIARFRDFFPVRVVSWWLSRIVLPLLSARQWLKRMLIIFANNTLVLALLVALGTWHVGGRIGVILAGLSVGMALFLLGDHLGDTRLGMEPLTRRAQRLVTVGVLLNLLEIGAIIITLGMAVGAAELGLSRTAVWTVFGILVMPNLLVAAGGEALWLGVIMNSDGLDQQSGEPESDEGADVPSQDRERP